MSKEARIKWLEDFLRQQKADQGGECTFAVWLAYVAETPEEIFHEEAAELVALRKAVP